MARRKKNKNLKGIPAAIMLILALIGGFAERGNLMERMSGEPVQNIADTVATGQMKVTYLNVGQGDCTIIQTEGHNAMIDAGNNHEGKDVVDYLNQQGKDIWKWNLYQDILEKIFLILIMKMIMHYLLHLILKKD